MHTGIANLPLHGGRAPAWLLQRMRRLAREIARLVVEEEGPEALLRRLADPFWFQALGCLLGFDWHSSGVTTTTCAALQEGLRGLERELGLFAAGGKGGRSRRTPRQILDCAAALDPAVDAGELVEASRLAAKVDSAAIQDGYQIYHHSFFFTRGGSWTVVQQGMHGSNGYARRYHWLSDRVGDPVEEPHAAVCCDRRGPALNLVARASRTHRRALQELARQSPARLLAELSRLRTLDLPARHAVLLRDLHTGRLPGVLLSTYERAPADFRELLLVPGLGPRALRALSLTAELLFGAPPSFEDPARFSFAHGGKDGHPYPIDRRTYERTIEVLHATLERAQVGHGERGRALRRLLAWAREGSAPRRAGNAPLRSPRSQPRSRGRRAQLDLFES